MNSGPRGGSELMAQELMKRLDHRVIDGVKIYLNEPIPRDLDSRKVNIFWNQHNHNQPSIKKGYTEKFTDQFDCIVYVSNWQYDRYRNVYQIQPSQSAVLYNAIDTKIPVVRRRGQDDLVRLIYTSTPFRGLDVLLDAFDTLNDLPVELDIFSSTQIYGKEFYDAEQHKYEPLFNRARRHPRIRYHGFSENSDVRQALVDADLFAYPSTFEETSCIAAIEAGFSGLDLCVTNLGALFETCGAYGHYTPYDFDQNRLVMAYSRNLRAAIENFLSGKSKLSRSQQQIYFRNFFDWDVRASEWTRLIGNLKKAKGH